MNEIGSRTSAAGVDATGGSAEELEQWHRFVHLLLLLVQSGRLDANDAIGLVDALGHPPDVARGRIVLYEIARRHEPDPCASGSTARG